MSALCDTQNKLFFNIGRASLPSPMRASLSRPPLHKHYLLWPVCDQVLIWGFFLMLFFCGSHPRAPGDPFVPGPFFANHPWGASSSCFVVNCPLSPMWHRDGLCDGTWMSLGVILGLRNNGRALFPLPSLTPFPSLNRCFSFVSSNLLHVLWTSRGKGEGNSSKITYFVPATEPCHCPFSNPLRPADGILIKQVRNLTSAPVKELS